jgi:uncharacterized membrane protein YdfJ with MMPL/SSD domain
VQFRDLIQEKFPGQQAASSGTIIVYRKGGLTRADTAYVTNVAHKLTGKDKPPSVASATSVVNRPELKDQLISNDGSTELMQVNLTTAGFDSKSQQAVTDIRKIINTSKPNGLEVHFTGQAPILDDFSLTLQGRSAGEQTACCSLRYHAADRKRDRSFGGHGHYRILRNVDRPIWDV